MTQATTRPDASTSLQIRSAERPVEPDPRRLRQALPLDRGREAGGVAQRLGAALLAHRHAGEVAQERTRSALDVVLVHPDRVGAAELDLCESRRAHDCQQADRTRPDRLSNCRSSAQASACAGLRERGLKPPHDERAEAPSNSIRISRRMALDPICRCRVRACSGSPSETAPAGTRGLRRRSCSRGTCRRSAASARPSAR